MKRMIILCAFGLCLHSATHAQNVLKTASSMSSATGLDINSLTNSITGKMTSTLGLSSTQQASTTDAVADFLNMKANLVGLDKSDPGYIAKYDSMFGALKSKLGTALTAAQMTKFMGMKPKTDDAKNVMSNLFY